jgi:acetaldehyde dehydrogenase
LDCGMVAGRDERSAGLRHAADLGYPVSTDGIAAILAAPQPFDVVFDATNAISHAEHWRLLQPLGTLLIDLTPSHLGQMAAPVVPGRTIPKGGNVSLISCGGQASVPIAHALASCFEVEYVEAVSTVASSVAGRATRYNLDEYVATTQRALTEFSGVQDVKAILNISPGTPPAMFRTTVHAVVPAVVTQMEKVRDIVAGVETRARRLAPGYRVIACTRAEDRLAVSVEVAAISKVLPRYAGNLDLINSAAILVAEQYVAQLAADDATGSAQCVGTVVR